jgi:hypothetical protein
MLDGYLRAKPSNLGPDFHQIALENLQKGSLVCYEANFRHFSPFAVNTSPLCPDFELLFFQLFRDFASNCAKVTLKQMNY